MNEKYILSKGDKYACLTFTNRVTKTELLEEATVFSEQEDSESAKAGEQKVEGIYYSTGVIFPLLNFMGMKTRM